MHYSFKLQFFKSGHNIITLSFMIDTSGTLSEGQHTSLEKLLKEATDASQAFSSQHKDSHGAISRMGKAIDRVSLT